MARCEIYTARWFTARRGALRDQQAWPHMFDLSQIAEQEWNEARRCAVVVRPLADPTLSAQPSV